VIDRDFPHQIELRIPRGGFGSALHGIYEFCQAFDYKTRPVGRERRIAIGDDAVRWCFKSPEDAATFQVRYGGEKLPPLTRERRRVECPGRAFNACHFSFTFRGRCHALDVQDA
jgi:hypothetical protein